MAAVRLVHTAELERATLLAIRRLLDAVFEGEFDHHDWDHTIGGMHALAYDGDELIAHGSVVQRRLGHGGRALRTGYVEGVGVRADRRREGHGGAVMAALERVIRGAYELGALGATDDGAAFYTTRGWRRWQGPTSALTPDGVVRTPDDDGAIFVLPVSAELRVTGELTCDWRPGDVW